jgi:hypothetical protein
MTTLTQVEVPQILAVVGMAFQAGNLEVGIQAVAVLASRAVHQMA